MFIEYVTDLELERALDFIYFFLPNSENHLDCSICRQPSNLILETSCDRTSSVSGTAHSLLTALMITKFFLELIISMLPSNFYMLNLMSSESSQNKLDSLLICQTFKYLNTGIIEVAISISACPGSTSVLSHENQFPNGKLSSSWSPVLCFTMG